MKKWISFLLVAALVLALSLSAFADEFTLDEHAVIDGMGLSLYQGYEPSISYNTMTIHLPIRAENCVGDITASIALDDANLYLFSAEPKSVTVSPKDGLYAVKLSLPLVRDRRNGDYCAHITLTGTDSAGRTLTQSIPYVIRIRDGRASEETLTPTLSAPVGTLNIGTDGELTLTVTNPSRSISIMGAVLGMTDASGEVLLRGSNRIELPEILPQESITVTLPVSVKANAAICTHTLAFTMQYQALGANATWEESFTLPVTQEIRLTQGCVQMPNAIAGELASMSVSVMNMGRGELSNVFVTLNIDGVVTEQSVLVGTLGVGETKLAKLTFTAPLACVGTHSGTVTLRCEDAYGNTDTQTLDVTLTVDEPLPEVEETEEEVQAQIIDPVRVALIVLCILLIAAMVIEGKVLTDKMHKIEEERL